MAEYTSKLNLKKPEPTDFYNIKDFNDNMDKIDGHKHNAGDITGLPDRNVNTIGITKQCTTETEADAFLNNYSASLPDYTHYEFTIDFTFPYSTLGGGTYYVTGFKTTRDYEYQKAESYHNTGLPRTQNRTKYSSVWSNWTNTNDNGNAETVNGKRASDFAPATHTHTKSQITDFPSSMPASDVPSWAKQASKPTYTASEVGALATNGKATSAANADYATSATNADKVDGLHFVVSSTVPTVNDQTIITFVI